MSLAQALVAKTAQPIQTPGQAPPLGRAPMTTAEANQLRQQDAQVQDQKAIAQMRVEQLAAAIFRDFASRPDVMENFVRYTAATDTIDVDQTNYQKYLQVANILSATAAASHARQVWNLPIGLEEPQQQTARPAPTSGLPVGFPVGQPQSPVGQQMPPQPAQFAVPQQVLPAQQPAQI